MERKFTKKNNIAQLISKAFPFVAFLLLSLVCGGLRAQTTIGTTTSFTNEGNAGTVTFNFQNTNSFPVVITNIAGILNSFGTNTVELWYKNSAISGAPGPIATSNGWTSYGAQSVAGVLNTTTTATQPLFTAISLTIPANTTYGIAISASSNITGGALRIDSTITATTISGGGCNIIAGPSSGFASPILPPDAPTLTNRGWIGQITFISGVNCTGTPNVPVVSGPLNICSNALFTLSASNYTVGTGITYQWQFFNTATSTWTDISGATGPSYTSSGITASTQFRMRTNCVPSSTQSLSNTLTVGIGTALPAGTYTINNNQPSSPTNFTTFTAAAAAMKCGITGAVTLNAVPGSGPYNEWVTFQDIAGTSPTSRIRLNGNGVRLQYQNTAGQISILGLQGTRHMTVDSLVIQSLGTDYGVGIALYDTAKYDTIMRCLVDVASLNTIVSNISAGISLSGNYFTSTSYYGNASKCYVGHNHVLGSTGAGGPYYGIVDGYGYYNVNYVQDSGNVIAYNEVENFNFYGILSGGYGGTQILYNDVHRTNKINASNFFGIRSWGGYNNNQANTAEIRIIGNRVHDPGITTSGSAVYGFYGIQCDNSWNGTNNTQNSTTLIANNAVYNIGQQVTVVYGIWFGDNYSNNNTNTNITKVYHNTVDINTPLNGTGVTMGLWSNDYTYLNNNSNTQYIKNNLVTITGGTTGNKFGFNYNNYVNSSNPTNIDAQRNNIYVNSTQAGNQYYGSYLTVNYPTKASFQAAYPTQEVGSLSVDPLYTAVATGNLTPLNYALYGNGVNLLADVSVDILGRTRSAAPTPGAFEIATDAGVSALVSPLGTYCSSIKEVRVRIINSGIITINNVQVNWSLNGVLQPPVAYTGNLPGINSSPNNTAVVSLGNGLFMPNTPVIIKAWTSMPNGQPDPLPNNDTLVVTSQSSTSVPVNLGPDQAICTGNTLTLDAGYPGSVYTWDNSTSAQTRVVSAAGTYYVRLTALDGCIGVDTFVLSLRPLPTVNLGPDREICLGETTTFDAGNPGATYLWDDGSTAQTRTVDTAGYYEVQVTDIHHCMNFDNVAVGMKDIPGADGINATHADSGTYTFYPINPRYTYSYTWDFGDGSPRETGYFVQHTYTTKGIYTVILYLEGECTGLIIDQSRTVDVFSVRGGTTGIDGRDAGSNLSLYPNPAKDLVIVQNNSSDKMQRLMVYNALGQLIINQKSDGPETHKLYTGGLANGIYTIRIETGKGYLIRKFEVLH